MATCSPQQVQGDASGNPPGGKVRSGASWAAANHWQPAIPEPPLSSGAGRSGCLEEALIQVVPQGLSTMFRSYQGASRAHRVPFRLPVPGLEPSRTDGP